MRRLQGEEGSPDSRVPEQPAERLLASTSVCDTAPRIPGLSARSLEVTSGVLRAGGTSPLDVSCPETVAYEKARPSAAP